MNSHSPFHRQGQRLSAPLRLVLIAAIFAGVGWSLPAGAIDQGWPREIKQDGDTLVYYQPQLFNLFDSHNHVLIVVGLVISSAT